MTTFDPTRPCSSKSKKPDRYTRTELETVAKSYDIQDIQKKTMDKLCTELKSMSQKQATPKPTTTPVIEKQKIFTILGKPCGTKFAKSGGYTRKELVELAEKYKVENVKKKNMDKLCQEIQAHLPSPPTMIGSVLQSLKNAAAYVITGSPKTKTTKQNAVVPKKKAVVQKSKTTKQSAVVSKKKALAQKKMLTMIHKKDPNAFLPNYFFNPSTKTWEFISGAPTKLYRESELKLKENSELMGILQNIYHVDKNKLKPHDDLVKLLLIYQSSKLLVAKKLKDKSLDEIIAIIKNLKISDHVQQIMNKYKFNSTDYKRSMLIEMIVNTDQTKLSKDQMKQLSQTLGADPREWNHQTMTSSGTVVQKLFPKEFRSIRSIDTNKAVASLTKKILQLKTKKNPIKSKAVFYAPMKYVKYNNGNDKKLKFMGRNVSIAGYPNLPKNWIGNDVTGLTKNRSWFEEQKKYQQNLSKVDQLLILSYTYGGDQIYHSWVSGKFKRRQFELSISEKYSTSTEHLLPILPILYKIYLRNPSKFSTFLKNNFASTLQTKDRDELIKYLREPDPLHSSIQFQMIGWMIQHLSVAKASFYDVLFKNYELCLNQIIQSSPPVQHTMVVYKGLKDRDFIRFDKETNVFENNYFVSTSIDFVQSKRFAKHNCCLLKITVLKGTKCLFPIFTYYPTELEVLFPTKRKFYLTKEVYKPGNDKYIQTENVVVVN